MKKLKVLHLPTNTGGNPQGVSRYLNKIGLESSTWTLNQNYYAYKADKTIYKLTDNPIIREIKCLLALRYVFISDVVFFNFGQTLFHQIPEDYGGKHSGLKKLVYSTYRRYLQLMQKIELALLKIQKKILLIQYQGDDARQGDFMVEKFAVNLATQVERGYYTSETDALKRRQIKLLTTACFKTYSLNPDLLHVLPPGSEFLPYCHISLNEWTPCFTQMENRPLRIGHAPSHRAVKGTALIIDALDALKIEGFKYELILVEGLSNADAKERYRSMDVLVDQLFAGWYGGVAVEAMALGKPVIAYIREEDLKFVPAEMAAEIPVTRTTPEDIILTLRSILMMPRIQLLELAKRSRAYVERWHDPMLIAKRIKDDIEKATSTM